MLFSGTFRPKAELPNGLFAALSKRRKRAAIPSGPFREADCAPDLGAADDRIATELYEGRFHFARHNLSCGAAELFAQKARPEEWIRTRDELQWLLHFLVRPRRLHTQYVACLLGFWRQHSRASKSISEEARKLDVFTQVLPRLAPLASDADRVRFVQVIQEQLCRLDRLRPASDMERCVKACATLKAAACHSALSSLFRPALMQLKSALSAALLRDGGPATGRLEDGLWLWENLDDMILLLAPDGIPPALVQARDALSAFLAMFQLGGGYWSRHLDSRTAPPASLLAPPLGHAPESGYTRLQQGPTTVLLRWTAISGPSTIEVAHNGARLVEIQCSPEGCGAVAVQAERSLRKEVGEALNVTRQGTQGLRESTTFLAADGCDIRFDERSGAAVSAARFILQFDSQARIMMTRSGCEATVVMSDGSCWVVKLRGGLLAAGPQAQTLHLASVEPMGHHLNWAIRKLPSVKSATRRPAKASLPPELPF